MRTALSVKARENLVDNRISDVVHFSIWADSIFCILAKTSDGLCLNTKTYGFKIYGQSI